MYIDCSTLTHFYVCASTQQAFYNQDLQQTIKRTRLQNDRNYNKTITHDIH